MCNILAKISQRLKYHSTKPRMEGYTREYVHQALFVNVMCHCNDIYSLGEVLNSW